MENSLRMKFKWLTRGSQSIEHEIQRNMNELYRQRKQKRNANFKLIKISSCYGKVLWLSFGNDKAFEQYFAFMGQVEMQLMMIVSLVMA